MTEPFTKVPNRLIDGLYRANLSAYESRLVWFIIRKTFGWGKKEDWISSWNFARGVGLHRQCVAKALKRLVARGITVTQRDDKKRVTVRLQTDITKWQLSARKVTKGNVTQRASDMSPKKVTKPFEVSPKEPHTKDNITKEALTKEDALVDGVKTTPANSRRTSRASSLYAEWLAARAKGFDGSYSKWIAR